MTVNAEQPAPPKRRTLRQRLAKCGEQAALFQVLHATSPGGEDYVVKRTWIGDLSNLAFADVSKLCALGGGKARRVPISDEEAHDLWATDEWLKREWEAFEKAEPREQYFARCAIALFD